MSLATLFPGEQPIVLGGRTFSVSCWRLRDILTLEQWILSEVTHPLADVPGAGEDTEPDTRKRRLRAVMAKAKA